MAKIEVVTLEVEDRIYRWRHQEPEEEEETAIDLLCAAEDELKRLRDGLKVILSINGDEAYLKGMAAMVLQGHTLRMVPPGVILHTAPELNDEDEDGN